MCETEAPHTPRPMPPDADLALSVCAHRQQILCVDDTRLSHHRRAPAAAFGPPSLKPPPPQPAPPPHYTVSSTGLLVPPPSKHPSTSSPGRPRAASPQSPCPRSCSMSPARVPAHSAPAATHCPRTQQQQQQQQQQHNHPGGPGSLEAVLHPKFEVVERRAPGVGFGRSPRWPDLEKQPPEVLPEGRQSGVSERARSRSPAQPSAGPSKQLQVRKAGKAASGDVCVSVCM